MRHCRLQNILVPFECGGEQVFAMNQTNLNRGRYEQKFRTNILLARLPGGASIQCQLRYVAIVETLRGRRVLVLRASIVY